MKHMPKTRLGKWSVRLIFVFFLLYGLFYLLVMSGQRGGDTFFSNLFLAIPAMGMAICGLSAFFSGLTSIIRSRERSVFVFVTTSIGLFILVFTLGEILFPH